MKLCKHLRMILTLYCILLAITGFNVSSIQASTSLDITFDEVSHIVTNEDIFLGCEVIENTLFAMSVSNGLKSFDISNKEQPHLLDDIGEVCYSHSFDICGDLYFLADATFGIKIFNISNPANLVKIGQYYPEGDGENLGLYATESLLVANEWHDSLGYSKILIINITDPSTPTLISSYEDEESFFLRFHIDNDLCYAASSNTGLIIFNISNPETITEICHYSDLISPSNFRKIDDIIYLTDANYFRILDVGNLSDIQKIGEYKTTNFAMDVGIQDTVAFVSEREEGLIALDITNPNNPQNISKFDTRDILFFDFDTDYLYLALVDFGIKIVSYNLTTVTNKVSIFPILPVLFPILGIMTTFRKIHLVMIKND